LGCALGLHERGHESFRVFEQSARPGGLGASFRDPHGFVWDIGAHIHLRRKPRYVQLLETAGAGAWNAHGCGAWIRTHGRLIPHPFQKNLRSLPEAVSARCLKGLRAARRRGGLIDPAASLEEWIVHEYGDAIAEEFLLPYCRKAWAYEPARMSAEWAARRFPSADMGRPSAPPYPASGGNGVVWEHLAGVLRPRLSFSTAVARVESARRRVILADGSGAPYDALVSTMPLDRLIAISDLAGFEGVNAELRYTSLLVIGLGVRGAVPPLLRGIAWVYSAEPDVPFFRATVHSSLSPGNVPGEGYWSLLLEVSHPPGQAPAVEDCVRATLATLAEWGAGVPREDLVSTWVHAVEHAYPIPTRGRAAAVATMLDELRASDIHSIGRFGAWRYENANQDDCFEEGIWLGAELV
jgi:protoporphyrinogen oxidase